MKCPVCQATAGQDRDYKTCPNCEYDLQAADANDPLKIQAARNSFKNEVTAYRPDARVTWWDRWRPWWGLILGALLFLFWLRACSTGGRLFW